jgi:threonine/homoserine/homoserine lactone efflux protein
MRWTGSFGLLLLLGSLALIPGPSDLLVAASAVRRGYPSAVRITLGILLADLIFILAVVYGASLLLEWLNAYEQWLQWVSSGVLILIGLWMLAAKVGATELAFDSEPKRDFSFTAGFTITFLDPKALAFYFGVLPTFFDIQAFGITEVVLFILLVSAVICLTKAFYAWIAVRGLKLLPTPEAQSYLLKAIGLGLIATGGWRIIT